MSTANLPPITMESRLRLRSLSKQHENGVVIIGWQGEYLELPPEGLDFLAWLNEGLTLAEAREQFEARHSPFPAGLVSNPASMSSSLGSGLLLSMPATAMIMPG